MSIILDALRRGRATEQPGAHPGSAKTDAVLQTLGYGRLNPAAPLNRLKRLLTYLALAILVGFVLWTAAVWLTRALMYQRLGDFENALVSYKLVLQRDASNIQAHNNLGVLYRDKGLMEDAVRHFQRALEIDPKNVESMVHLSTVEKASGRNDEARRWLAGAMLIDPHNPEALYNLGLLEDEAGNREQAQNLYGAFLEYGAASHPAVVAQVRSRIDALAAR